MNIEKRKLAAILILALATASVGFAYAIPAIPHKFWGTVYLDGYPAPGGLYVDAYINGINVEWTTTDAYGDYVIQVPGDDPDTSEIEGGVYGDLIEFYVWYDSYLYAGSYYFESGSITYLDLYITSVMYEIQLYGGWNLIGIPFIPENPDIEVMLSNIIDYVEVVWSYDAWSWYWSSYSPWVPPALNDLTTMTDGKGYWIYVYEDVLWEIG